MTQRAAERILSGAIASAGLAIGTTELHRSAALTATGKGTADQELARLDEALESAAAALGAIVERADETGAEILAFQLALIEDPELVAPARAAIAEGAAAAEAWNEALGVQIADYEAAEDDYFRARALDLADLRERVLLSLAGETGCSDAAGSSEDPIYLAEDLTPSRFLELDWTRYRGAALLAGSSASHVAILARARGVPLLVGLEAADTDLPHGARAVLDAAEGKLVINPSPETSAHYATSLDRAEAERQEDAAYLAKPAETRDGERVQVMINVDDPSILTQLDPTHCDGIGLTRTEFQFHGRDGLPSEEEQYQVYARILAWAAGRPVTIRTLDAGGDKPIAGLTPEADGNPFLGVRGLRLSLARPDVFRAQLRAVARAAAEGPLKVMFPMVTTAAEMTEARALFAEEVAGLKADGQAAAQPPLGMMVEVPAAALDIAAYDADFYSIGSNDLVQYVMAAARDNGALQSLMDPLHPAVLELIRRVTAHGAASGKEVSLCGDMASDPDCLDALLDSGLQQISVAPARLGGVKRRIAGHG